MTGLRFTPSVRFSWNHGIYEVERLLPGDQVVVRNAGSEAVQTVGRAELEEALFAGELTFLSKKFKAEHTQDGGIIAPAISHHSEGALEIARWRWEVIHPLVDVCLPRYPPLKLSCLHFD